MAWNLGQFMSSGIFIYVMLLTVTNEHSAQFRKFREQLFPFHGLSGYGQNIGMANLGKAEFFFLSYFIDFGKGPFQFREGQALGGIIGVIVQITNEVIPVFPVGISQSRFHVVSVCPLELFVERQRRGTWC
jgi:hypothetical protein